MNIIKDNIIQFMFGGNSTFTIQKGNNHFSYKIYKKRTSDGAKIYHLYLKSANKGTYCGYFKIVDHKLTFRHSGKYGIEKNDSQMNFLLETIHQRRNLPEDTVICHCGRCAHCGRMLTDPKSMERGFGPECWQKVKGFML